MSAIPSNSTEMLRVMSSSIGIINDINPVLLSNVLLVIIKRLSEEEHVNQIFLDDEKSKLKEILSLSDTNLEMMLSTLLYLIRQAAYNLMKPENLMKYLNELGFSEQGSSLLSELWSVHAKSIIDTLKKEPCSHLKLESVESSMHYVLSSHTGGHTKVPLVILHFNVNESGVTSKSSSSYSLNNKSKSTLSLEFTQQELLWFYQILETVQSNLDELM